ncbi:MAG: flagellar protein FlgN [Gammaproteobacteria bacterium]|nr:MAG: flagellar protein FlgN [Gammaproteobacteria bacterium]
MNISALRNILNDIDQSTQLLLSCLQNEFKALNDKQYDILLSIAEQKQHLIDQLNQLDRQRQQYSDDANFSQYLLQQDSSGRLADAWQTIRANIGKCQQQNSVNGRLLQRYYRLSQETISLLTGRPNNSGTTYGPNGLTQSQSSLLSGTRA